MYCMGRKYGLGKCFGVEVSSQREGGGGGARTSRTSNTGGTSPVVIVGETM